MNKKFERPVCRWDVKVEDGKYNLFHDGYAESPVATSKIDVVAEQLASMMSRTVMAMPKNNATRITIVAIWD